jgi:hypothetical protein
MDLNCNLAGSPVCGGGKANIKLCGTVVFFYTTVRSKKQLQI